MPGRDYYGEFRKEIDRVSTDQEVKEREEHGRRAREEEKKVEAEWAKLTPEERKKRAREDFEKQPSLNLNIGGLLGDQEKE
ncbi:hypothetical protein [Streptomyces sp. NPDC050504]|uniref:hypothetical protein n=1 Tax=Streptomyces sp. NPDC050504 TaxID=3365618 RepID=UPI00379457C1